jgi:hypothetical protein
MLKRGQVWGLAQPFDRDEKTHVGEYPADEEDDQSKMEKFAQHGFYELRITDYVIRDA